MRAEPSDPGAQHRLPPSRGEAEAAHDAATRGPGPSDGTPNQVDDELQIAEKEQQEAESDQWFDARH